MKHLYLPFIRRLRERYQDGWQFLFLAVSTIFACLLASIWFTTLGLLDKEKQLAMDQAQERDNSLAIIASENLTQVLDRGRLLAIAAGDALDGVNNSRDTRLMAMARADRALARISIFRSDGTLLMASSPSSENHLFNRQIGLALFNASRSDAPWPRLAPVPRQAETAWHIPLLFPVYRDNGSIDGVMLCELDLGYLLQVYRSVDLGDTGYLHLLLASGEELVRSSSGGLEELRGDFAGPGEMLTSRPLHGNLTAPLLSDGNVRKITYHRLERYPFMIVVSREVGEILVGYHALRLRLLSAVTLLSIVVAVGIQMIFSRLDRKRRIHHDATKSAIESQNMVASLRQETQKAFEIAFQDHLTGLPNRRMFTEIAANQLAQAARQEGLCALLFTDLIRFKEINDSLGHRAGDQLLRSVAERLRASLRESDTIARLGGDEFVIITSWLDAPERAESVATKIIDAVAQSFDLPGNSSAGVGISIGIALYPAHGQDIETLMHKADIAMYAAKSSGQSSYRYFDPSMEAQTPDLLTLPLRTAIESGQLSLRLTPRLTLVTGETDELEVTACWEHPKHGRIPHETLLDIAARQNLLSEFSYWIVDASCGLLSQWRRHGPETGTISFKALSGQLRTLALAHELARRRETGDLPPHALFMEIDEADLGKNLEATARALRTMDSLGVGIILGGFGKHFPMLADARAIPFQRIRISQSLTGPICAVGSDAIVLESLIELAHRLGVDVIAGEIDDPEQLQLLSGMRCDRVQGKAVASSLSADAFFAQCRPSQRVLMLNPRK